MKRFLKCFLSAGIILSVMMLGGVSASAAIPQSYWKYQDTFKQAADEKNNDEIIRMGKELIEIFKDLPMDKDKAGIMNNTYDAMYSAYERKGDYESAIACLKEYVVYNEFLGFSDAVKIGKQRIKKIDPMTEVYALTKNTTGVPYYGMKNEPKSGTYFGRVFSDLSEAPFAEETIISFYVECLEEDLSAFDYLIRPYADGKKIIHIALNMPNENDSLKRVLQPEADTYINNTMEYIKSLNTPVLLRIGGEMNVWENLADADTYKKAYIKIADKARAIAPNAAMVFSPNEISNWNVDIGDYYPGDSYVDWVGVSLYTDKFRNYANPIKEDDFSEMYYGNGDYANPLTKLRDIVERYGDKKPIIITESGSGHAIAGSDMDLKDFANNRINMLYTYANMLYPQVKGVIYFDVNLKTNKYVYSLGGNSEVMAQYKASTGNNKALTRSLSQPAEYVYTKAGAYNDNQEKLNLFTYCILPGNILVTTEYFMDGKSMGASGKIPFECSIDMKSVAAGTHELKVVVKGENGYNKTKVYNLVKEADGRVKIGEVK